MNDLTNLIKIRSIAIYSSPVVHHLKNNKLLFSIICKYLLLTQKPINLNQLKLRVSRGGSKGYICYLEVTYCYLDNTFIIVDLLKIKNINNKSTN